MQFKMWLENNVIKNQDGSPRIFYHGTNANFATFSPMYTVGQMGFHFGTKEQALEIGNIKYLFQVYLTINNPLRLSDLGAWRGQNVVDMVNKILGIKLNPSANDRQIAKAIMSAGYDGVVYKNQFEGDEDDSYIVFSPNQIHIINCIPVN
jgi:hypothetical protein